MILKIEDKSNIISLIFLFTSSFSLIQLEATQFSGLSKCFIVLDLQSRCYYDFHF